MGVIRYVRVSNFRSIRTVTIDGLDDYNPIIGLNSSGKSNLLRALNLFFNGYVDETHRSINLATDLSEYAPKRKKKSIAVTVGISLGGEFKVRGQDDFQRRHSIVDVIYIRRTWTLAPDNVSAIDSFEFGADLSDMKPASIEDVSSVLTYIRAVRFVYVPNHVRPAELIRSELDPLRATLVARLRSSAAYKKSKPDDVLTELGRMGDRMFGDASKLLRRGLPGTGIAADLPSDFADLVFTIGVNAVRDGALPRSPEFEGSGAQAFMLLHILDLADRTRRAGGFGWVQASVWGFEEPESFLHAGLRAQFSTDLRAYADDPRRQIFVTTHQDEFVRVSTSAWLTGRDPDATTIEKLNARDALVRSTRHAVTSYRHPMFEYPDVPIVLVEGKFDEIYLRAALSRSSRRPRWKLLSPDRDLAQGTSGDGLLPYLKVNSPVLASRPDSAPVIVLRDWEGPKDKAIYDKLLASHPFSTCLIAPDALVNPALDESFVGIERYLDSPIIEDVVAAKDLGKENGLPGARHAIKKRKLDEYKPGMSAKVRDGVDPGPHMLALAEWLDDQVAIVVDSIPTTEFP